MQRLISEFKQNYANQIWSIFVITVFLVFTWSICIILWDIPALLLKYNISDIVGYIAYQLTFALVESVIITILVTILSFLLPAKLIRNNLSVRGSLFIFTAGLGIASLRLLPVISQKMINSFPAISASFINQLVFGLWLFFILVLSFFSIKAGKSESGSRYILKFLERLSTLSGIYVFISICSFVIVIFRNMG